MHAAPARYVSVSELYSADEVELLLDEIRELEPTSCRGEDVQDFEIAGSGLGGVSGLGGGGAGGAGGGGGRSPCGTELTERSWDSHAMYSRAPPPRPRRVAPLYCRLRLLAGPRGCLTLLLVCCSAAACGAAWAGAGLRTRLPLASRVRLLLLAALSSTLLHAALLFMHVTRLTLLLPIDWGKLGVWCCVWSALGLSVGGGLSLHAVLAASEYRAAPAGVWQPLLAAAALALAGAAAASVLLAAAAWGCRRRGPRVPAPSAAAPAGPAYRAVPAAPPPPAAPQPSTSRDDPL